MKRKFYCDIFDGAPKDIWLCANSTANNQQVTLQKNSRRVEFFVDLPDECFVQSTELKKVSQSAVVLDNI